MSSLKLTAAAAACALLLPLSAGANVFTDFFDSLFGSGPIGTVQEAVLPEYSKSITLGDALDNYQDCRAETQSWSSYESRGREIVEFQCRLSKSPEIISSNKANSLMLGLLGAASLFTGETSPDLSREAMQAYFKFERMTLSLTFAMSKLKDDDFELDGIKMGIVFSDGQRGEAKLDKGALARIFADKPIADFASADEYAAFVQELVAAHDADLKAGGDTI